jgi:hypothetical protein
VVGCLRPFGYRRHVVILVRRAHERNSIPPGGIKQGCCTIGSRVNALLAGRFRGFCRLAGRFRGFCRLA